jgi:hypothetical protein
LLRPRVFGLALAMLLAPAAARAQADLFSPDHFHGVADIRVGEASGERGWTEGGFGKTGLTNDLRLSVPRAAVEWTPELAISLEGHVTVQYEPKAGRKLDLNEAFLSWRAPPSPIGKAQVKAGIFYPPVSLEHTGATWTTPDTLSASAINSWIGEEVLVGGLEVSMRHDFGGHELSATGAVFGWDDTSGTLLAFRGWALHGLTTGADTRWKLPPLSTYMGYRQGPYTRPRLELDNRAGWYGKLEWRPPAPISVSAVYFDNSSNKTAVDSDLQWGWETRFTELGVKWEPAEDWTVLAQAIRGETQMGYREGPDLWVDVGYRAAYLMGQKKLGADTVSGRLDWFATSDRTIQNLDDNVEDGWAGTVAWRHHLARHLDLMLEAQKVHSSRNARPQAHELPHQNQTGLQAALRVSF